MRWSLVFIYVAGAFLFAYGAFAESNKQRHFIEMAAGAAALILSSGIDQAAKVRQARRQPYTTTDWLKGKRPPGGSNPRLRLWLWVITGCCSGAQLVLQPPGGRTGVYLRTVLIAAFLAAGSLSLFEKPRMPTAGPQ